MVVKKTKPKPKPKAKPKKNVAVKAKPKAKVKPKLNGKGKGRTQGRTKVTIGLDRIKALNYRLMGLSYRDIGEKMGCSHGTAFNYVMACLKDQQQEPAREIINMEMQRLDEILFAMWGKVLKGDAKAADTVLRVMDRRAKLQGLDAPKKIDLGIDASIDDWRSDVQELMKDPEAMDNIVNMTIAVSKKKKLENKGGG